MDHRRTLFFSVRPFGRPLGLILVLVALALLPSVVAAVELPAVGNPTYIQTNAANTLISEGDWYTASAGQGGGAGYHYIAVDVPCGWPAAKPIDIDLFSPEMNSTNTLGDESAAPPLANTTFELYQPGTVFSSPATPGPGAAGSIATATYPTSAAAQQWVRFATLNVAATGCGRYLLRAQSGDDDQNSWRVRVGDDNDANPTNAPPATGYDNADDVAGTGDELIIGVLQASFQHDAGASTCLSLFEYVPPGQPSVTFHNFDMDGGAATSRYFTPGNGVRIVGTVSGNAVWNSSATTTRVGDTIASPASGWWRTSSCMGNHNQYIQEGQTGAAAYYEQPPTPQITLQKSDGRTQVSANNILTYTLTFNNISNLSPAPGAATDVVLQDTLPTNTTYVSCDANGFGVCSESGGVVTFTFSDTVDAGSSGQLFVVVQVNGGVTPGEQVINGATLSYDDAYAQPFQPVSATDIDSVVPPAAVTLEDFAAMAQGEAVRVQWTTAMELENLGFHLWRGTDESGPSERLNAALIPSQSPGGTQGYSYEFLDSNVEVGTLYYYWLEDVDVHGHITRHGPVWVKAGE